MLWKLVVCRLLLTRIQAPIPWFFFSFHGFLIQCSSDSNGPPDLCKNKSFCVSETSTELRSSRRTTPTNVVTPTIRKTTSTSMITWATSLHLPHSTTFPTVIERWELSFKIKGTYKKEMDDRNSTEHLNLTGILYDPITNSCRQVLGRSFVRVKRPLRYSKGSILVTSVIELNELNPHITNTTTWENSLSSTLPGLFIENSTSIKAPTDFSTTYPKTTLIGATCGVFLSILILILVLSILIWRKKIKRKVNAEDQTTGQTQLSLSLPATKRNIKWRESSGTIAVSDSINSQKHFKGQEVDQIDRVSLHRPNVERISFEENFQPSSTHKDLRLCYPLNEFRLDHRTSDSTVSLPRIIVPQDEFETMTTSSTSQSVQVVMSNNSAKSSSLLPQRSEDVKPADFGGLFVPESTTTTGRASSFGLKLNRVNTSMRRNEEVKDIDLSSLSNAGDLHSLKPSNSDANVTNPMKTSHHPSLRSFISQDHEARLHRDMPP